MIRLRPIQTQQSFSIIPSSYDSAKWDAATVSLVENGTNKTESDVAFSYAESANSNYIVVTVAPTITLKEDQIYTLKIEIVDDILYRDLVYITSDTSKTTVFSYPEIYDEYDSGDNEYIVL